MPLKGSTIHFTLRTILLLFKAILIYYFLSRFGRFSIPYQVSHNQYNGVAREHSNRNKYFDLMASEQFYLLSARRNSINIWIDVITQLLNAFFSFRQLNLKKLFSFRQLNVCLLLKIFLFPHSLFGIFGIQSVQNYRCDNWVHTSIWIQRRTALPCVAAVYDVYLHVFFL